MATQSNVDDRGHNSEGDDDTMKMAAAAEATGWQIQQQRAVN
jgi:hypothetical protein